MALFVQKRLASGDSKADIARKLGKSRQHVTLATALIEAPAWLLELYRQGRCRGTNELYALRRLHGEHPERMEAWASGNGPITRDQILSLRNELSRPTDRQRALPASAAAGGSESDEVAATQAVSIASPPARRAARHQQINTRLHVEFEGQDFQLVVSVAPAQASYLYIRPLSGGPRQLAPASALKLRGFVGR
jgi:ParB family chromosome partitioning protein